MEEMFEADVSEYASALICGILYVNAPASDKKRSFFEPFAETLQICDTLRAKAKIKDL